MWSSGKIGEREVRSFKWSPQSEKIGCKRKQELEVCVFYHHQKKRRPSPTHQVFQKCWFRKNATSLFLAVLVAPGLHAVAVVLHAVAPDRLVAVVVPLLVVAIMAVDPVPAIVIPLEREG